MKCISLKKKSFRLLSIIGMATCTFLFGCEKEEEEPPLPEPQNNPPVVSVYASPKEGKAPIESRIKIDGTDKDGKSDIANYSLEIEELGIDVNKKQPIDTTITFSESGEYTIKGTVRDKAGEFDREEMKLYVDKNPSSENKIPVASTSASPLEGTAPLESLIKVEGTDQDSLEDIKKYYLSIENLGIDVMKSSSIDTNIVFSNPGEYNIRGIVEDAAGARDTSNVLVNVSEKPNASVSQSVSLKDYINLSYGISFENTDAVQLDLFKDGEKILSKEINDSEHSEVFSYSSNDKITKGNYEFVASFKTNEGKDTSVVSNIAIPNYNPEVDWGNLNIDFDENSSKTVTLPIPTDKNPEDNPVNYVPESFSSDKAELEFNSEDRSLEINGSLDNYGVYSISASFGSHEGGFGDVQKYGEMYEKNLPGMNPFATPNIFGQGENKWEYASREEKLEMLDEANAKDKSWEWEYENGKFTCMSFARAKSVNMFGCENLESWDYYSIFENAIENNNLKIRNGYGNIPVYQVATDTDPDASPNANTTSYGHAINGTWVGPDNNVEKRDVTNFDQWVFFEPQRKGENGTYYVQPGDWQIDDNGEVRIYWFGNIKFDGITKPRDYQILQYQLTDGKAELDSGFSQDGIANRLITEDPYQ